MMSWCDAEQDFNKRIKPYYTLTEAELRVSKENFISVLEPHIKTAIFWDKMF